VIVVRKARIVRHDDGRREEIPAVTKPVSNGEINRELTALKRIFTLAVKGNRLTRAPYIRCCRRGIRESGSSSRNSSARWWRTCPRRSGR
jgi:hypothetical protein